MLFNSGGYVTKILTTLTVATAAARRDSIMVWAATAATAGAWQDRKTALYSTTALVSLFGEREGHCAPCAVTVAPTKGWGSQGTFCHDSGYRHRPVGQTISDPATVRWYSPDHGYFQWPPHAVRSATWGILNRWLAANRCQPASHHRGASKDPLSHPVWQGRG